MAELKALIRKKERESGKKMNGSVSHENVDPEVRLIPERNVQTLIKPQLTNPKIFWSKSEDEDFSSDQKYQNVSNTLLEEKVITNVFKPIRSEISPDVVKVVKSGSRKKDEVEKLEKGGKSIHESLRIQKARRRTSLPFFWEEKPIRETMQSSEKIKTYDVSYYSSTKKNAQEGNADYYSCYRKNAPDSNYRVRSASDECIYGEKESKPSGYPDIKPVRSKRSDRISVTEPSSPLPSDNSLEINRKLGSTDSEIDSLSTGSDRVLEMKKSKSFVEEKNADGYFKAKVRTKKASNLEIRKPSLSSASSCDSAYRTRSLRRTTKSKKKSDPKVPYNTDKYISKDQNYSCQIKKYSHWSDSSGRSEKQDMGFRRTGDFAKRERSQSWNREQKKEDAQKINPDVFQHLLDVLMQKNRTDPPKDVENRKESYSKSLPRSHARRLKDPRYDRDYLKIIKSMTAEGSREKNNQYKTITRKNEVPEKNAVNQTKLEVKKSADADTYQRRRRSGDGKERSSGRQASGADPGGTRLKLEKTPESGPKRRNSRGSKNPEEECVIRIEDKQLWIEICKAVEKVDAKGKKIKKCT